MADRAVVEADIKARLTAVREIARSRGMQAALDHALETRRLAEATFGGKHGYVGAASRTVGGILYQLKRYPESANAYFRALVVVSQFFSINHEQYKLAVNNVAQSWSAAGQPGKVIELYEHILKSDGAKGGDTFDASYYRLKLGALLRLRGRFAEAKRHFLGVVATREREKGASDRSVGFALTELGGLQRVMGRYSDAEATYLRSLAIVRAHEGSDHPNFGITLDNLAYVYNELGRRADAERLHRQALAIFEAKLGPDHVTTATGLSNLATLYYVQDRDAEARPLYDRALAVYRKHLPPNDPRIGVLLDQYAGLQRRQGNFKQARELYAQAIASLGAAHGMTHPETAKAINNMALAEQALGNLAEAERLMRQALAAQRQAFGPSHFLTGAGLGNLGDVLLARKQLPEALAALRVSVSVIEASVGTDHPMLLAPLRTLAGVSISLRQWDQALDYSRRAVDVALAEARRDRLDLDHGSDTSRSAGTYNGAIFVAWSVAEAMPERRDALAAQSFETAQWLTSTAAGRTLAQIGARVSSRDAAIAALVRRRQDLGKDWARGNQQLLSLVSRPVDRQDRAALDQLRGDLGKLEMAIGSLDDQIRERFPDFAQLSAPRPLSIEGARALLGPGEALVQYASIGESSYVWVVTRQRLAWHRLAMPTQAIARAVATLRCGVDSGEWIGDTKSLRCLDLTGGTPDEKGLLPFDIKAASALYDGLLRPIAAEIKGRSLLIVPSGSLMRLPFQVLIATPPEPNRQPGNLAGLDWMVRRQAASVLPSVGSLAVLRGRAAASKARLAYFGVGNPLLTGADDSDRRAFDVAGCDKPKPAIMLAAVAPAAAGKIVVRGGVAEVADVRRLTPLPETADEVCQVSRRLKAKPDAVLLGPQANEGAVKKLSEQGRLGDYRIIHFATHGLVSGEMKGLVEPALVLTPPAHGTVDDDGLLMASEVAGLRLDADWVVLSACNTGAGGGNDSEALSGLANAFFHAGARSLLVSHWPVQSSAAVSLVSRAVAELKRNSGGAASKGEALRRAMVAMLASAATPVDAHPQTWAPFVVIGETGRAASSASSSGARRRPVRPPAGKPVEPGGWSAEAFTRQ